MKTQPAINQAGNPVLNLNRDVDEFTRAYIICALWTYDEQAPPGQYETSGRPETLWTQLARETIERMMADCARFQAEQADNLKGYPVARAGHDFWLTRNHHGAGYWENEFGSEMLCNAAHAFGETDLYEGDDGQLYLS